MKPISPFGLPIGFSIFFWSLMSLSRLIFERFFSSGYKKTNSLYKTSDVAVIIPAHNEEAGIKESVRALAKIIDRWQIYVVSDGSSDRTYERARMEGCHVSRLNPGRGKAKALVYLINRFRLFDKYKLIFIVDADNQIDEKFFENALPIFSDSQVGVVFASSRTIWPQRVFPTLGNYFVAYRVRLIKLLESLFTYGQTWKYTNVSYVIPGSAALYKADILKNLEIDTPGLLTEDFNLAFQFHKKKLGKIGYTPSLIGWEKQPDNLRDYWNQVRRWNIGFFQTVKKNGVWPSFFWLSLGVFSLEVLLNSIFIVFLPLFLIYSFNQIFSFLGSLVEFYNNIFEALNPFEDLTLVGIFIFIFLLDYSITAVIAAITKRPVFFIYGIFFFFLHFVTSLALISSIYPGFFKSSAGRWVPMNRV